MICAYKIQIAVLGLFFAATNVRLSKLHSIAKRWLKTKREKEKNQIKYSRSSLPITISAFPGCTICVWLYVYFLFPHKTSTLKNFPPILKIEHQNRLTRAVKFLFRRNLFEIWQKIYNSKYDSVFWKCSAYFIKIVTLNIYIYFALFCLFNV